MVMLELSLARTTGLFKHLSGAENTTVFARAAFAHCPCCDCGMWRAAAGIAAVQLQSTCRKCPAAALRFLAAVSSRKPDVPGPLKSATARSTDTQGVRPRVTPGSANSARRTPQRARVDAATFRKQVQLSKDLISMRHTRWRGVLPRFKLERKAGLPFDVYIFAAAITVLGSAGQFDDVMKLWQLMQRD
eukprot:3006-Heterococcus_DN1.PRE.1